MDNSEKNLLELSKVPYFGEARIILRYINDLIVLYYNNVKTFERVYFSKNQKIEQLIGTQKETDLKKLLGEIKVIFSAFREELRFEKYQSQNRGLNNHLKEGVNEYSFEPRLLKLVLNACKKSLNFEDKSKSEAKFAPSPLSILYNYLIVPDEQQSSAFSLYACRTILFIELGAHPYHRNFQIDKEVFRLFTEENVLDCISTFKNYISKRDNVIARENNPAYLITAHFLAMKGLFFLRFNNEEDKISYFRNNSLKGLSNEKNILNYEFRLSKEYTELLPAEELINNFWGIPVPIKGLDTLFFGGIKKDATESVVLSLSGQAGIGKTSLALSIAANFSAFDTKCFYITLEENPEDLKSRIISIIPDYLKRLSFYKKNIDEWFYPRSFELKSSTNIKSLVIFFKEIQEILKKTRSELQSIPNICPLIIVIDSINGIISNDDLTDKNLYDELENFVKTCRDLQSFIILLSAEDLPRIVKLDYLVDIVIDLKHEKTNILNDKPIRILRLLKTRHQLSRPGSHLFHLSGPKGLRVSPQIPSQMDKKILLKRNLPDKEYILHTFNLLNKASEIKNYRQLSLYKESKSDWNKVIQIYDKSQILIHGHGSSGKSGLALKILLTPPLKKAKNPFDLNMDLSKSEYKRKILVISFLYPGDYYDDLIYKRITPFFRSIYDENSPPMPEVKYLAFYPGFLNPEDFVLRVSYALDEAILRGEPFTGVLLDGLHNVFLQFPNIQEHSMVWPMLYTLLNRYNVTTVSTFTTFLANSQQSFTPNLFADDYEDRLLMQKGQKPFLHALVQASDFYFRIEPYSDKESITKYRVVIESAFDQPVRSNLSLFWNRENLTLHTA